MRHPRAGVLALSTVLFSGILLAAVEGSAGGLRWTMPARWQVAAAQPMRVASYAIPSAPGTEPGGCGVFYFGNGQGGGVEENLARWAGQFEGGSAPKKSERTVNGLKVHLIIVSGTYLAPSGPMMQSQGKKPGWSLSGAIVEAPEGLVFFKCVGPSATIEKAQPEIDELLKSLTKAGAAKA
jgi:hypothetical protein